MTLPWLVDCDPALGLPFRDIDDALAIHALLRAGVALAGLTTVFGNASVDRTTAIARGLAPAALPVYRGAGHPGDLATPAVDVLVAHRGPVLGLGPCTNLAAALRRGARWERLVLLGGPARRSPNVRYLHLTELNFALDAEAASLALGHATHLFPMEVCRQVVFTRADVPTRHRAAARSWLALAPWLTRTPGFHPWDVLPALWIVDPGLFVFRARSLAVDTGWPRKGSLVEGARAIEVATGVDVPGLVQRWRSLV
jgi:inosine-uridine nucleoside N-ribohydrolase